MAAGGAVSPRSRSVAFCDPAELSIADYAPFLLAFNGYNSSFFSQLTCEVGAHWLARYFCDQMSLPPIGERRRRINERLAWMEERTQDEHASRSTMRATPPSVSRTCSEKHGFAVPRELHKSGADASRLRAPVFSSFGMYAFKEGTHARQSLAEAARSGRDYVPKSPGRARPNCPAEHPTPTARACSSSVDFGLRTEDAPCCEATLGLNVALVLGPRCMGRETPRRAFVGESIVQAKQMKFGECTA